MSWKPVNTWLDLVDDVYYSTFDQIYLAAIVFFLQFFFYPQVIFIEQLTGLNNSSISTTFLRKPNNLELNSILFT